LSPPSLRSVGDEQARLNHILLLYDKLIVQDKPDPNNPEDIKHWLIRKRALQKMMLEELDLDQYVDILLGPELVQRQEKATETPLNEKPVATVEPLEDSLPPEAGRVHHLLPIKTKFECLLVEYQV